MRAKPGLKWERVREESGWKPRSVRHYEACYHRGGTRPTFRIAPHGGHITVKRYWLSVYSPTVIQAAEGFNDQACPPLASARFFKLGDAKAWAEDFLAGGAMISPNMLAPPYT